MEKYYKLKLTKRHLNFYEVLLLLIPFVQIRTYQETPVIGWVYFIASLVSSIYIFFKLQDSFFSLWNRTYVKIVSLFFAVYIFPSLIYFKTGYIISICRLLTLYALFLYLCYACKISVKVVLSALSKIYATLIVANFVLFILVPEGLYKVTKSTHHSALLLGDDNALIYVFLPGLTCMICHSLQKSNTISILPWFALLSSIFTLFAVWSISAMICITVFFLCVILLYCGIKIKPRYYFIFIAVAISIVLFGLSIPQIRSFIEVTLQKDITLTGRTFLWQLALREIASKPIFGYGGYFLQGRYDLSITSTYPCHTQYLQMLLDGGAVLFVVYWFFVFYLFTKSNNNSNKTSSGILVLGLSCMMINYITEYSMHYHFIIIAALICNLDYFKRDVVKNIFS